MHSACPPFLICHGDSDTIVSCQQSVALYDALRAVGVETALRLVSGAGHHFEAVNDQAMTEQFFDRHLQ